MSSQFLFLSSLPTAGNSVDTGYKQLNLFNTYGINVSCKTDQSGTLTLYWSNDGVATATTDTDSIGSFDHSKQYKIKGKFVKLQFTNGTASNNTIFNLKASLIQENIVSTLPMDVNIVSGATSGGDASEIWQQAINSNVVAINTTLATTLNVDDANTQGKLDDINANVVAINTTLGATLTVDGSAVTQPISATALPLPTGASSEAKQDGINSNIVAINSTLGSTLTVEDTTSHAKQDSINANVVAINTTLGGTLVVDGSASTQPISATALPLPTGASTEATLSSVNTKLAGTLVVDGSGVVQPVSASTLPLPLGASTSANQTTTHGKLDVLHADLIGTLNVDGSAVTQPISATALPLPTGASTTAKQDSINANVVAINTTLGSTLTVSDTTSQTSLSSIDTKLSSQATLTEQQTQSGYLNTINASLAGTLVVDGSAVIQPISASTLPLPTGAATEATLSNVSTDVATLAGTVNVNGEQKVSVSAENIGTHNNVANNITLNAGATTTSLSIAEIAEGSLFYEDSLTSSLDGLEIQVSVDNTNWYRWGSLLPYQEAGSSVRTANVLGGSAHGLRYLRLKNISSTDNYTNVNCTIAGSH